MMGGVVSMIELENNVRNNFLRYVFTSWRENKIILDPRRRSHIMRFFSFDLIGL